MKRVTYVSICLFLFNVFYLQEFSVINYYIGSNDYKISFNKPNNPQNGETGEEKEISDYDGEDIGIVSEKLDKYFENTVLQGYGNLIAKNAGSKGISPYLIASMILVNTNCRVQCKAIVEKCNNVGDIKGVGGCFGGSYKKYETLDSGIKDLIQYVNDNFYSKELKTPYTIYKSYGKDISWAYNVNNYMQIIKK